jgi:hypothetical protein
MSTRAERTPQFHEVVVEGHFERSHGMILGLFLGAQVEGRLFFSHEEGVHASFGERLREAVGLHAPVCHAVVDDPVRDLLQRRAHELALHGVRIAEMRPIRGSRFEFSYRAYAPRYAQEIRDVIAGLPPGVELTGEAPRERVDPAAVGVEAYAPVHHYEFEGEGAVHGRIDAVIEARRRLAGHPLVKVERIDLELG